MLSVHWSHLPPLLWRVVVGSYAGAGGGEDNLGKAWKDGGRICSLNTQYNKFIDILGYMFYNISNDNYL